MATCITVHRDHADIRCPYRLKYVCSELPERKWSASRKCWVIPVSDVSIAAAAFKRAGELVEIRDLRTAQGRVASSNWAAAMFGALPANLRAPAFRALAKVLHPDIGGDTAAMAALTVAFREVDE